MAVTIQASAKGPRPVVFVPTANCCMTSSSVPKSESASTIVADKIDLSVRLGRLSLPNPILVASGTFGYAREMKGLVDLSRLGGILPKTVTQEPRAGNAPWRTVETSAGMLNSIGLDNDGLEAFIEHHVPYLTSLSVPIIASIAGRTHDEFVAMCRRLGEACGDRIAAIELNISCPNVSHGVDFGVDPTLCEQLVTACRAATSLPIIAKLTPNVTSVATMAGAAEQGGADALSLINTCLGMAIDWRNRKPMLGNVVGGLSGPAIKPIALRCVWQAAQATETPIIGIGGIATIDDVMEFIVAGASAVQLGTVNFYRPTASMEVLNALPGAVRELGAGKIENIVGTLRTSAASANPPPPQGEGLGEGAAPEQPTTVRQRVTDQTRHRAVELRKHSTTPEQLLWNAVRNRQIANTKFRRQHPIESYIVDFFSADAKLIIELDGESHEGRQDYDARREQRLKAMGYQVLRFTNDEVLENLDGVLEVILRTVINKQV